MAIPEPIRRIRAVLFFAFLTVAAVLVLIIDLILYPVVVFLDKERFTYHRLNALLSRVCVYPFFTVRIHGLENLDPSKPTVFAVNHQSGLDAFILAHLGHVNFKCTFKREILFYPGLGQCFWLANHIPVRRGDPATRDMVLARCRELCQAGVSVLFFPEGTRKVEGKLNPFKSGAFITAKEAGVTVTPMTIKGARAMMPPRGFPSLGRGSVDLTIFPPIETQGRDYHEVKDEVRALIVADTKDEPALPPRKSKSKAE